MLLVLFGSISVPHTNVLRENDFRAFYCRAGVSPAIERLKPAGLRLGESYGSESGTPAHHSAVQKQAAFGMKLPIFLPSSTREFTQCVRIVKPSMPVGVKDRGAHCTSSISTLQLRL
jgi:hypothetical protein